MKPNFYEIHSNLRCTWVAQLVECQTVDFGSSPDPKVMESSPTEHGA